MLTLSIILMGDLFGLIPKKDELVLDSRKKVCEILSVQLSIAKSQSNNTLIETSLENFVTRNEDVIAASMSTVNGKVVSEYGVFEKIGTDTKKDVSSNDLITVPIYAGDKRWGYVNVEFVSIYPNGIVPLMKESLVGVLLFVAFFGFIGYVFILRRALHVLDPKAVVPDRVRKAFNTLSEGVLILDNKEHIMMANESFAKHLNKLPESLVGLKASDLKWKRRKEDQDELLPWICSIKEGVSKIGDALNLSTPNIGVRSISINSAPILDEKGKIRGALVTFDDITEVEETNILLENAVTTLQQNDVDIRLKNEELEVLATRDPLTGCYNRRAFFDLFEDAYQHAITAGIPLSVFMADIDLFKSINDNYGHAVGDEVIRMVAEILNSCETEGAIVGRYGGEEFCIVLPNTDLVEAKEIAEKLRLQIHRTSQGFCGENTSITSSFGVAAFDDKGMDPSELLECADKAMYVAKRRGRNRVVCWGEEGTWDTYIADSSSESVSQAEEPEDRAETNPAVAGELELRILQKKVRDLESELKSIDGTKNLTDPVTGLPTRAIFEDRISQAMVNAARSKSMIAVATLNIDMFSRINATFGRVVGDEVLRAVGKRLKTILRRSDTVATLTAPGQAGPSLSRLENGEFAILLTGLHSIDALTYVIKRIQEKFSGKITVSDQDLFITTTIGLALYPNDSASPKSLIECSQAAQKQAKGKVGKNNYQFFSKEINARVVDQMQLEIEMHTAIEKKQFKMFYQPKLDISTGSIVGTEALIRWEHPTKGMILPDSFIPAAEKTGMIVEIGKWCLRTACEQAKLWLEEGASDSLRVAVNVSAVEFSESDFVKTVVKILKETGLSARHLEIEITETTVMHDLEESKNIIDELKYHGITVALDDFGTGYSSFNYLGKLNPDVLKLDRKFLLDAMGNERSRSLYAGIVAMAHEIKMNVVAEGVENMAEFKYVKSLNISEMQGFLLSKPVDASRMTTLLFAPESLDFLPNAEINNLAEA